MKFLLFFLGGFAATDQRPGGGGRQGDADVDQDGRADAGRRTGHQFHVRSLQQRRGRRRAGAAPRRRRPGRRRRLHPQGSAFLLFSFLSTTGRFSSVLPYSLFYQVEQK